MHPEPGQKIMGMIPGAFLSKIYSVKHRNMAKKTVSRVENTHFLGEKMSLGVLHNFLSRAQKVSEKVLISICL